MMQDDDEALSTEADVSCPHCGEPVTIGLDPGGGSQQNYVEDCQVCCQPWAVRVTFGPDGSPDVTVSAL